MDQQQALQFTYFVSQKELPSQDGILLLVALAGRIHRPEAQPFEKLIEEITAKPAHWVILSLRDVGQNVERTMFPALARLQKVVRDKPAELKLCGVHPELKISLESAGIIRSIEIVNNLAQALTSLSPKKQESPQSQ
jgi:anti-anti-sigma regulatory factor